MNQKLSDMLSRLKRPLVLAVGGGNDSVSTLLLQKQLMADYSYRPEHVTIAAMLPDCLDYHDTEATSHPLVVVVTEKTTRSVNGKTMTAFPERVLAANNQVINGLPVCQVIGLLMTQGSVGLASALQHLVNSGNYDGILAIDVGGDFIAVADNIEVLSPMMDGYALHALRTVESNHVRKLPFVYAVFGLGTDGESTPAMLAAALDAVAPVEAGVFSTEQVSDVIAFYRNVVEPNRYSRTADFTIHEIMGQPHDNPAVFRARFHVQPALDAKSDVTYGTYQHEQDPRYFGKYYVFSDITRTSNPFSFPCENGIEWFLRVQNDTTKINHELNGQAYRDIGAMTASTALSNVSLLFGTPSRKFSTEQQSEIAKQVQQCLLSGVHDLAFMYTGQPMQGGLYARDIGEGLCVVGTDEQHVHVFSEWCLACQHQQCANQR